MIIRTSGSLSRAVVTSLALACASALLLPACTRQEPQPSPSQPTPSVTAATPVPSPENLPGADAALTALVKDLYAGKEVPTGPAAAGLKNRKPAGLPAEAKVGMGEWKGTKLAVAQAGKDATLLIQRNGTWTVIGGWWPSMGVATTLNQKRFVFFMGSDARPHQNILRERADALHIVGFDGKDGAGVMGIARDSWVPLSTGGVNKINAAMSKGGPEAQVATVGRVAGIPLKHWLVQGFEGFIAMMDEWGGIQYTLPPAAAKRGLPVGNMKVGGWTMLTWARERKALPRGDFDRQANQNDIMMAGALVARAAGPAGLPRFLTVIQKHSHSNMDAEAALTFFSSVFMVDPNKVGTGVAAGGIGTSSGGASIVKPGAAEQRLYADMRDGNLVGRKR